MTGSSARAMARIPGATTVVSELDKYAMAGSELTIIAEDDQPGEDIDATSAVLTVLAAVALLRFKRGVIEVIVVSALIGLALSLLR